MNKKILAISLSVIAVLTLTFGISFAKNHQTESTTAVTDTPTVQVTDTAGESKDTVTAASTPLSGNSEGRINAEKALNIALTDAGLAEADVWDKDVDLDFEKGQIVYEVSFEKNSAEYDYIIDAQSGDVLYSKNHSPDSAPASDAQTSSASAPAESRITAEQARSIALKSAGFESAEVWDKEVELDYEQSILVYEVSFEKDNIDYDYIINAHSGEIVRTEVDPY